MTLASKTADILALATQGINHLIFAGQDSLLSADERKTALTQLVTAMQAAGKLADVVHMEALAGAAKRRTEDTEGLIKEENCRAERVRAVAETQRLEAEANRVGKEAERAMAGRGRSVVEMSRLEVEADEVGKEAERAVAETERLKAEAVVLGGEKIKINPGKEKVKAETEQTSAENEMVGEEVENSRQVQEGYGPVSDGYLQELDAQIARNQNDMKTQGPCVDWVVLRDELVELRLERTWETLRRMQKPKEEGVFRNVLMREFPMVYPFH